MFLSFDGVDGAGKSTQIRLLADWLSAQGREVVCCRDPGGTPLGEKLRAILLDDHETPIHRTSEMLLFMASRAQLVEQVIRPALEAGKVVISDRYLLATAVYQAHAGGLRAEDVWTVGKVAVGGVMPAKVLLLDMPAAQAASRIARAHDRMEAQGIDYLEQVRQGFLLEAKRQPEVIATIDASLDPAEVHAAVLAAVAPLFPAREIAR